MVSRVPDCYRTLALCYLVLGLVGGSLLSDPEGSGGGGDDDDDVKSLEAGKVSTPLLPTPSNDDLLVLASAPPPSQKEYTTREMMGTLNFFVLISCFFACGTGGMYISATYKSYGEGVLPNSDDLFFTAVGSAGR